MKTGGLPTSDTVALQGGCRPYTCGSGTCSSNPTCSVRTPILPFHGTKSQFLYIYLISNFHYEKATCSDGSTATKYTAAGAALITGVDNIRLEIFNNGPVTAAFDVCNSFYTFFNDANNAGSVYTTSCSSSSSDYMGGHAISVVGY
jgi:hypothetical protein